MILKIIVFVVTMMGTVIVFCGTYHYGRIMGSLDTIYELKTMNDDNEYCILSTGKNYQHYPTRLIHCKRERRNING